MVKFASRLLLTWFLSAAHADTSTTRVIDLSYRHNLDVETLTRVIEREEPPFSLDVGSSLLGDKGVERILQTLLSTVGPASLSLTAHTNGLTPRFATKLFRALLNQSKEERIYLDSLDLSWNHLHSDGPGSKTFHKALEQLLGNATHCPRVLRFDRCGISPSACRAMGKGLIHRYTHDDAARNKPTTLSLCGNTLGDGGAAAIAATLRSVANDKKDDSIVVFERLDLSACGIGDAGAEAIALALEASPCCLVQHLDLSNNKITESGAEALARALATATTNRNETGPLLISLDLSNNNIGDAGASAIATCIIENELVPSVILRSCHIHADGAESLGKALRKVALQGSSPKLSLDLSGNPFGILRGKSKHGGGKYSASALKSKASATAVSYMNQGFSFIKKGLRDVGMDIGPSTMESDDEEEKRTGDGDSLLDSELDPSRARCGGRALVSAFITQDSSSSNSIMPPQPSRNFRIGLRHCFFDHAAADALAEMKLFAKDNMGIELELDVRLNNILEDEMVSALHGEDDDRLREMAEAHVEKMSIIRQAQERAKEAAQADAAYDAWDIPVGLEGQDQVSEEEWDSDADYENEEDVYY